MVIAINGVEIDPAPWPSAELAAAHELLRQRAVVLGMLDEGAGEETALGAIEQLLLREVQVPEPGEAECRRWYETRLKRYRSGELVHARHILFQVTAGAPLAAVRAVAEETHKEVRAKPDSFAEQARTKSNCPSGAQGGSLGQLTRGATVPEFERAVFDTNNLGILPKLVNTRFGFHIVAVDKRIRGEQLPFEIVAERIRAEMANAAQKRALTQYVQLLAGQAEVEGVALDVATTPLVQ